MQSVQILLAEKVESTQFLFGLDQQLVIDAALLAVNIFILFIILSYLLINPVKELLAKRQEKITNDRESAAKDKKDAAELKKEYDAKIKNIEKEAEIIMADARKAAMKNQDRIIAEAKEEAANIIKRANAEIELEKKKAADDIKKEIIQVATAMANKVVAASIDAKTQDALIEETLREIGDNTWLS